MTLEEARRAAVDAEKAASAFAKEHRELCLRCADITRGAHEQINALIEEMAKQHALPPDERTLARRKKALMQRMQETKDTLRMHERAPWVNGKLITPKTGACTYAGFVVRAEIANVALVKNPYYPTPQYRIDRASLSPADEAAVATWEAGKWPPSAADADLALAGTDGDPT